MYFTAKETFFWDDKRIIQSCERSIFSQQPCLLILKHLWSNTVLSWNERCLVSREFDNRHKHRKTNSKQFSENPLPWLPPVYLCYHTTLSLMTPMCTKRIFIQLKLSKDFGLSITLLKTMYVCICMYT